MNYVIKTKSYIQNNNETKYRTKYEYLKVHIDILVYLYLNFELRNIRKIRNTVKLLRLIFKIHVFM